MRKTVHFRGALVGAQIRQAQFDGREYLVVPVVALCEGAIHAANANTPELVLAEEFGKCPDGWNGRPVLWDHPILNGIRVSGNEPLVLERMKMGEIFHTLVDGDKLKMEAWLDVVRCTKMPEGARTLERVRANDLVEVSVGCFVETEPGSGLKDGVKYSGVWRNIVPDHLAMLPEGTIGACSVEMGCGAPRAASKGGKAVTLKELREKFQALAAKFRTHAEEEEIGDTDVRYLLEQALYSTEPAFLGVIEVFSESNQVVYCVAPDGVMKNFRRGFSIADGKASLEGTPEEVKEVRKFEPMNASAPNCGCGGPKVGATNAPTTEKEKTMIDKKRVAALVALHKAKGSTQFLEAHVADLEACTEVVFANLEASAQALPEPKPADVPPVPAPVPAPATPPVADPLAGLTEEKVLQMFPNLASSVNAHKAAEAQRRGGLLAALSASKQTAFTEAELATKGNDELEKMVKLVGASAPKIDNSGRGGARDEGTSDDEAPKPPDMTARILAARQKN